MHDQKNTKFTKCIVRWLLLPSLQIYYRLTNYSITLIKSGNILQPRRSSLGSSCYQNVDHEKPKAWAHGSYCRMNGIPWSWVPQMSCSASALMRGQCRIWLLPCYTSTNNSHCVCILSSSVICRWQCNIRLQQWHYYFRSYVIFACLHISSWFFCSLRVTPILHIYFKRRVL